jgi:hypothetical protein
MLMLHRPAAAPAGPVLRDIHLPPAPGWWPPAPGWWVLAGLLVLVISLLAHRWWKARQRALRRDALMALLEVVVTRHAHSPQALAAGLHDLLRRAARRLDPAAVTKRGEPWRATLARVAVPGEHIDQLMQLDAAMYRPQATIDCDAMTAAMRAWLSALPDASSNARTPRARPGWRRFRDAA